MSEFEAKLAQLQTRLKHLENYEAAFKREITDIRREINILDAKKFTTPESSLSKTELEQTSYTEPVIKKPLPTKVYQRTDILPVSEVKEKEQKQTASDPLPINDNPRDTIADQVQNNLEKFIGENLISKIGIIVLVIGVGIGAKYAIDNNYITPLMRIIFGYIVGFSLIGLAVKLKAKYHDYSAVLMSGGMAIMYFITYFAYSYYALLSQTSAFSMMVIFTIFTVLASIIYNRQIIAHIGLVGAYAVPFLLSEGSNRYAVLFTYIAIINLGILAVSVKKYWKPLFYNSFVLTWLIYTGWYVTKYYSAEHFTLSFTFLTVFFFTFYLTFLAYKVVNKEEFRVENIFLILVNSFIFYGFGYGIIYSGGWEKYLGLFTILNALIHFVFASIIHHFKLGDKTAFYFLVALTLTFITIAVPVQFEGNWITVLWMAEALFLFTIGRTKAIPIFEYFSYPLIMLASFSLLVIWLDAVRDYAFEIENAIYPIFNENFVTSLFIAIGFGIIYLFDRSKSFSTYVDKDLYKIIKVCIPAAFLIVLYNTFRIEIGNYFHYQELKTAIKTTEDFFDYSDLTKDESLQLFNFIWQLNYTQLFLTILSFINIKKLKSVELGFVNLVLNSAALATFLLFGLFILNNLSSDYLYQLGETSFNPTIYNILIRYITFAFVAALVFACYRYIKQELLTEIIPLKDWLIVFDVGLYFLLLVVLSSELILWSDIIGIQEIYRLGLTILFGSYAVILIILGIIQKKQHLRIFAIALFGLTLLKLFFYDIAELGTISKTVVFVSVGILLLIASFLYTKYKNIMFEDEII